MLLQSTFPNIFSNAVIPLAYYSRLSCFRLYAHFPPVYVVDFKMARNMD